MLADAAAGLLLLILSAEDDGERDGGLLTVAGLDRERIYRKLVLGGLINEYSRAA